jgi:hypothetical protein
VAVTVLVAVTVTMAMTVLEELNLDSEIVKGAKLTERRKA